MPNAQRSRIRKFTNIIIFSVYSARLQKRFCTKSAFRRRILKSFTGTCWIGNELSILVVKFFQSVQIRSLILQVQLLIAERKTSISSIVKMIIVWFMEYNNYFFEYTRWSSIENSESFLTDLCINQSKMNRSFFHSSIPIENEQDIMSEKENFCFHLVVSIKSPLWLLILFG